MRRLELSPCPGLCGCGTVGYGLQLPPYTRTRTDENTREPTERRLAGAAVVDDVGIALGRGKKQRRDTWAMGPWGLRLEI